METRPLHGTDKLAFVVGIQRCHHEQRRPEALLQELFDRWLVTISAVPINLQEKIGFDVG